MPHKPMPYKTMRHRGNTKRSERKFISTLAPISETSLRKLLRATGVPLDSMERVRQSS